MSWLTDSAHTMSSTPSYPRRAAYSKAASVLNGYTEAVERPTLIAGRTSRQCDASVRLQKCQGSQRDERTDRNRDQGAADVLGLADDADTDHQAEDDENGQHQRDDGVPPPQL